VKTSEKNFAWRYGKSSRPLAEKVFSIKKALDLLKVFEKGKNNSLLAVYSSLKIAKAFC